MVSTNRVYRLALDDGSHAIVKSSNYGSFFHFAEDHDRLHRAIQLLRGGPYEHFMAGVNMGPEIYSTGPNNQPVFTGFGETLAEDHGLGLQQTTTNSGGHWP